MTNELNFLLMSLVTISWGVCMCEVVVQAIIKIELYYWGFSDGSAKKNLPVYAEDPMGLILGSGRSPGGGNGSPLQYSCLGNPMDRGAWGATVRRVTESRTQLRN